jgi:acyl-homoserine-lactone acylase
MSKTSRRHGESVLRQLLVAVAVSAMLATSCSSGGSDGADDADGGGDESLEVRGAGDTYEAHIKRTTQLVPHIEADSIADLAFGQGWVSAEDHACTLADQVVKVRSERARYHGTGEDDANLNSDLAYLAMGLYERARTAFDEQPADVQDLFTGFAEGYNLYLETTKPRNLDGWCAGEPWVKKVSAVDVYAYGKSVMILAGGGQLLDFIATATPPGAPADQLTTLEDEATEPSTSDETEGDSNEDSTTTTSNGDSDATTTDPDSTTTTSEESALSAFDATETGSNGWAIGGDRAAAGHGMLVANPHFPWEGELRFWESHLIIPDELNVYGAQLLGLPGIGIGFNANVGWTHTVSAGDRLTPYTLDLVPGDPISYLYDGEPVQMEAKERKVRVLQDDGTMAELRRTLYTSQYGPIINFPGVGWSDTQTLTYRDANIDNDVFAEQYLAMANAESLDALIESQKDLTGIPFFNTIAVGADGDAWYADTAATPNLSQEALDAYAESLTSDPLVAAAAEQGFPLLDGSNSLFEWVEEDGARSPGLVPFDGMPQLTRRDYVFNANDSYWLANDEELIEGDFTPFMGDANTARSTRTRQNAVVLSDTAADGPAGEDGKFDLDELKEAILANQGFTADSLLADVLARCDGVDAVDLPALTAADGTVSLPAATIDPTAACDVLDNWDGLYNLDSVGAHIWRELMSQYPAEAFEDAGELWAEPFDAADPVGTPSGLAPPPDGGDPLMVNLARAVQTIEAAGWPLDAPLGEIQYADRAGERVPIHGGTFFDGITNIVAHSSFSTSTEPATDRATPATENSQLTTDGYLVNTGTSFLMALEYTEKGPKAGIFLTYGETGDPERNAFVTATQRFSDKAWRSALFSPKAVEKADSRDEYIVRG